MEIRFNEFFDGMLAATLPPICEPSKGLAERAYFYRTGADAHDPDVPRGLHWPMAGILEVSGIQIWAGVGQ
jgi:hypothetical protein